MPPYNIVGSRLRKLREERGLSQQKLAEQLQRSGWDVSRDIVARIEGHVRFVSDYELLLLARGIGMEVQDLIETDFPQTELQVMQEHLKSTRGRR